MQQKPQALIILWLAAEEERVGHIII